jgi:hypothetical protein
MTRRWRGETDDRMEKNKKHDDHTHEINQKPTVTVLLHNSLGGDIPFLEYAEAAERAG